MARRVSLALVLALAFISTMATSSLSLTLSDLPLTDPFVKVTIRGVLTCSLPPSQPSQSPPIAGVNVILQCGTNRATVADALTNLQGVFVIVVENTLTALFNAAQPCKVVVRLPIAACAVFPPSGILEAPLTLVESLLNPLLGGLVGTYEAGSFVLPY